MAYVVSRTNDRDPALWLQQEFDKFATYLTNREFLYDRELRPGDVARLAAPEVSRQRLLYLVATQGVAYNFLASYSLPGEYVRLMVQGNSVTDLQGSAERLNVYYSVGNIMVENLTGVALDVTVQFL